MSIVNKGSKYNMPNLFECLYSHLGKGLRSTGEDHLGL